MDESNRSMTGRVVASSDALNGTAWHRPSQWRGRFEGPPPKYLTAYLSPTRLRRGLVWLASVWPPRAGPGQGKPYDWRVVRGRTHTTAVAQITRSRKAESGVPDGDGLEQTRSKHNEGTATAIEFTSKIPGELPLTWRLRYTCCSG
jgi:hypothetical protein